MYVVDGELTKDRMEWEEAVVKSLHDLHDWSIRIRGKYDGEAFEFMWSTEKRLENALAIIRDYHSSTQSKIKEIE